MTLEPIWIYRTTANASIGTIAAAAGIAVVLWAGLDRTRRWLAVWLILDAVASLAESGGRYLWGNTRYVTQVWHPLSAGVAVALLASVTHDRWPAVRRCLPASGVTLAFVALTLSIEQLGATPKLTGALHGLVLLLTGVTLVFSRLRRMHHDMLTDSRFLAGAGFMLVGAPSAVLSPAVHYFGSGRLELQLTVYGVKNLLAIVGYLVMVAALHPPRSGWVAEDGTVRRWD